MRETAQTNDPALIALAAVMLTTTAALTAFSPARRASRTGPVAALRYE